MSSRAEESGEWRRKLSAEGTACSLSSQTDYTGREIFFEQPSTLPEPRASSKVRAAVAHQAWPQRIFDMHHCRDKGKLREST